MLILAVVVVEGKGVLVCDGEGGSGGYCASFCGDVINVVFTTSIK